MASYFDKVMFCIFFKNFISIFSLLSINTFTFILNLYLSESTFSIRKHFFQNRLNFCNTLFYVRNSLQAHKLYFSNEEIKNKKLLFLLIDFTKYTMASYFDKAMFCICFQEFLASFLKFISIFSQLSMYCTA